MDKKLYRANAATMVGGKYVAAGDTAMMTEKQAKARDVTLASETDGSTQQYADVAPSEAKFARVKGVVPVDKNGKATEGAEKTAPKNS
ncbi:hypothetical protein H9Q09_01125 [Aurantimonas sp. DM33-3]|uniref:hypothetical protein n=1 Tax=Aurantimonas sp. DM33-3 TaxID=2766955 RepID=UPI001652A1F4|nr:hypothetical protein [Aurantimonas sp. DM33-3]MBC6714787.1 hypothetical protein [Aurantimonas sp. DM33-3]